MENGNPYQTFLRDRQKTMLSTTARTQVSYLLHLSVLIRKHAETCRNLMDQVKAQNLQLPAEAELWMKVKDLEDGCQEVTSILIQRLMILDSFQE